MSALLQDVIPHVTTSLVLLTRDDGGVKIHVSSNYEIEHLPEYRFSTESETISRNWRSFVAYAAVTRSRYGRVPEPDASEHDELLDRFMPEYEVIERHHTRVAAPATITLTAAREQDLLQLPLVRPIFKAREMVLRATPTNRPQPRGLVATTLALGWGILAERT